MRYDHKKIMTSVQQRSQKGETVRHMVKKHEMELETVKTQHAIDKSKLKKREDVEKRRVAGLKKAQAARKKTKKS